MKKNLVISLLLVLLLTGCKAKYSLEIKDGKIKESFEALEKPTNIDDNNKDEANFTFYDYAVFYGEKQNINTNYQELHSLEECGDSCVFYDKKFINDSDNIGFKLEHVFDFDDYSYSSIANEYINGFNSYYDGKYLSIKAGNNWKYLKNNKFLSGVEISIDTDYKVLSTNLKKNGEGHYVWTIDNSNINSENELFITLDTSKKIKISKKSEDKSRKSTLIVLIAFVGILFMSLIVSAIYKKKKQQ